MKPTKLATQLMRSTVLTGVAAATAMPAFAQDTESDDVILVTGSRIERPDLDAPSPLTTVDAQQLTLTNTVNTEQFLNTLPQVIPAFDSTSNNPGNGTATVNLRGLGTQRTLVLVDGSRFPASGPAAVVDLNNIPAALVERIDVVTGGASAVYGSDAVAGVVNFILKDDFEGVQLDLSDEMSAAGWDANIFNAALTMGGNFADGRGNAVVSLSYTNREPLLQGDRDFSTDSLFDPGPGGTEFLTGGSGNALGGQFVSLGADDFSGSYPCTPPSPEQTCTGNVTFNGAPGGRAFITPQDQYNYAPVNYLQLPQERYSIYAGGSYEINDRMEVYARGVFAQSVVDSQLAATPVGGTFTLSLDNPNLPSEFAAAVMAAYTDPGDISDLDGDGTADDFQVFFARRYNDDVIGPRNSLRDQSTFQIQLGLRGDLGDNWSWDVYGQFGRSSGFQSQTGNISFSALQAGVFDGSCDVFGVNTLSQGCSDSILRTGIIATQVEQTQIVGTISGVLDEWRLPGAENGIGLAVGVEYREEFANFQPDSVLGPDVRGFNAALPVSGRFDVYEAFMETDIPVIENSFVGDVSINGAYRFSSYSTGAGDTNTFAAGVNWQPVEDLRIRGQFQRAVRAPNISELFSPFTNGFPGANDPCSGGPNGAFDGSASTTANCIANGVPASEVGEPFQLSGQIEALFGGNPNVEAEVSDTYTVGAIWQPSSIDGLVLQIDYYNISIDDAINFPPLSLLLEQCYVQGQQDVCDQYFPAGSRSPSTGRIGAPFLPMIPPGNFASFTVKGIDFNATYSFDLGGDLGSVNVLYYGNYNLESSFKNTPEADLIECAGFFAGDCGEPTPEYKHTMQASWLYGPLTTSVRWRLIGGTTADFESPITTPDLCAMTPGACIGNLSDDIDMFNYVDVTLQYAMSEHLDLTVGVQNITGKEPPLLGSTVNEQANTWPATYETLGRQLFLGASIRF